MAESVSHKTSLVAQVIADLSYEPLDYQQFKAELQGAAKTPEYKTGGYFAFANLFPGDYVVLVSGERFQTEQLPVSIPVEPGPFALGLLEQAGDNELVVAVKTVNASNRSISFDGTAIRRPISAGSFVVADGLSTSLATRLDAGKVASARLASVAGLGAGSIVRIIRDRSIRLRLDPYYQMPADYTRIVGQVTLQDEPDVPLENAQIRLTETNGVAIEITAVAGANIANVTLGGSKIVLGTERDIQTLANSKGDYNLYFDRETITDVTLTATLAGFQTATRTILVTPRTRIRADFQLTKI